MQFRTLPGFSNNSNIIIYASNSISLLKSASRRRRGAGGCLSGPFLCAPVQVTQPGLELATQYVLAQAALLEALANARPDMRAEVW